MSLELKTDGLPKGLPRQKGSKYDEVRRGIEKDMTKLLQGLYIEYKVPGVPGRVLNNRLNDYFRTHPPNIPEDTYLCKWCTENSVCMTVKYEKDRP